LPVLPLAPLKIVIQLLLLAALQAQVGLV